MYASCPYCDLHQEVRSGARCIRCEQPILPTLAEPIPEKPIPGRCSKCGDGTDWEYDQIEGWVSTCCWRAPQSQEAPAWMEES